MTERTEVSLTEEEIIQIAKDSGNVEVLLERSKTVGLIVSYIVRGVRGEPPEAGDIITRLTNIKNILERSRFPTYPLLAKQVYLRLIALYHPECYHFKNWADFEAEALISYKGLSREENVEMAKAQAGIREGGQQFYFGPAPTTAEAPSVKRHFWSRAPKPKEPSEFASE